MHARRDLRLVSKCVINVSNQVGFDGSLTVLGITQETVTIMEQLISILKTKQRSSNLLECRHPDESRNHDGRGLLFNKLRKL